jgi:hypothetical protein
MSKDIKSSRSDGPSSTGRRRNTVELLGKEAVEGTEAWKLLVTQKNGDVTSISTPSLPADQERRQASAASRRSNSSLLGDYKEVGGLMFAHRSSKPKGAPGA